MLRIETVLIIWHKKDLIYIIFTFRIFIWQLKVLLVCLNIKIWDFAFKFLRFAFTIFTIIWLFKIDELLLYRQWWLVRFNCSLFIILTLTSLTLLFCCYLLWCIRILFLLLKAFALIINFCNSFLFYRLIFHSNVGFIYSGFLFFNFYFLIIILLLKFLLKHSQIH